MAEPIIFSETDFEENLYNFYTYMMYKGKPFTGTVIIEGNPMEDNALGNKQIIEFKDGNADGYCLEYHRNGQLICDYLFKDGEVVIEKDWFPDGQLQKDWNYDSNGKEWYKSGRLKKMWDGQDYYTWDEDGILARKNTTWFYKNGQQMTEELTDGTLLYFSSSGEIALRRERLVEKSLSSGADTYYYYDYVLSRFRDELFTDHYKELGKSNDQILYFFGWVGAVYNEDPKRGDQIIEMLIAHQSEKTHKQAAYLKRLAIKKEAGSTERTSWLEKDPSTFIIIK